MNQITTGFEKLKKIVIGEKDSVKRFANHSVNNANNYVKKTFKKSYKRFNKIRKNRTFRKPWHIGKIRR